MKQIIRKTPAHKQPVAKQRETATAKTERWCLANRYWIIAAIIVVSLVLRVLYYQQTAATHFIREHANPESDMAFFDQGAGKIVNGDLLSKTVGHPQHTWMKWVADRYFQSHPDKLETFRSKIGTDTLHNNPTRMLWNQWYGENTFQQEPLYPYFVAMNYALFGKNVQWVFFFQLFLGIVTNLLIYLVTRRYFGDLAATVAGFLAVFCGPMLFFEMVLLRSSMAVFLGILLIYVTGIALDKKNVYWWFLTGITAGVALMVHSFFLLFLLGSVVVLPVLYRKNLRTGAVYAACLLLGLILTLTPVVYRNVAVGASPLSLSSTSALSFVTMNNADFSSFIGWNMNLQYLSDILGDANGRLFKTIIPTLKTHTSTGSYLSQVWNKFHATFSWYEIPNNVNFYLYREFTPILFLTFVSFLILSPLALVGIFLSLYKKKDVWPLYLMILVYLFPMLAFMVLARYRIIFVPVLIPFAALTIIELAGSWKGWKNYGIVLALVVLGYWASTTGSATVSKITKNDYSGIWSSHYAGSIKNQLDRQQWDTVAIALSDFLSRYEPKTIAGAPATYRCENKNESEIFDYFSMMHANLSRIYNNISAGDKARSEDEISVRLKEIATRQPRNL
jgi:4-amino-4-deoxy-L-arabinose transferase-like glycosyltransferase